jgi:ligand-binding SRPBCC domain-containing protein
MHIKNTIDGYVLETEQWIPRSVPEVFSFFAKAENLEKLTPPFLGFHVVDMSTRVVEEGTKIRYRLKIHGIPVGWTTEIMEWVPGAHFVDHQLKGPYAVWHHTHTFQAKEGGTLMRDRVLFRLPFGILGDLVAGWLVKRDVRAIFAFRYATIERLFPIE